MAERYIVNYNTINEYNGYSKGASWQFLVLPVSNNFQKLLSWKFSNSLGETNQITHNSLGFRTIRLNTSKCLRLVEFKGSFEVINENKNPFEFNTQMNPIEDYKQLDEISFKLKNEPFLRQSNFTRLPNKYSTIYLFDVKKTVFENLQELNAWVYNQIVFESGVTHVETTLDYVLKNKHGVCQDFTHLFLAIARKNKIPARYVSGYLHQGNGFFGDSQMHAWAEAYVPFVGWIGFDPTNNLLISDQHIKVCHGIDYKNCSPIKGVIYGTGNNKTSHSVEVISAQQ